jgi:hypothetical protein
VFRTAPCGECKCGAHEQGASPPGLTLDLHGKMQDSGIAWAVSPPWVSTGQPRAVWCRDSGSK